MKYMYAILAITVVIMLVVGAFLVAGNDGTWETPWETSGDMTGKWEEEIIIEYEDGTTDSLKILGDNELSINPFSVKYQDKEIIGATYNIYATATGEGFTGCEIAPFTIKTLFYEGDSSNTPPIMGPIQNNIVTDIFDLDTRDHIVNLKTNVVSHLGDEPSGIYSLGWTVVEKEILYRGIPNGEWKTVDRPPGRIFSMQVIQNEIYLTFETDFDTF